MSDSLFSRFLPTVVAIVLVFAFAIPATALAAQTEVEVDNHLLAGDQETLSEIFIYDVDTPEPGTALDSTAKVSSAEDVEWEIPVLWIADNSELSTEAQEGRSYLPALAFYLPKGYAVDGSEFTVTLSDSLTELFGSNEIVSVYSAQTGITYILPASLRDYFASSQSQESENQSGREESSSKPSEWSPSEQSQSSSDYRGGSSDDSSGGSSGGYARTLIDIYCAQTARDAFSDEDLEFLLDLVLNKLEPQSVELLLDSFPAFRAAADQGQIGREIGLYVYYKSGDIDGIPEHEAMPANAPVSVRADAVVDGDNVKYCYMIGIDLSSLARLDEDGNPVRDSKTGKFVLLRDGENMTAFENAIVHELFHAIMDDHNRTGMVGATDIRNAVTDDNGAFPTQELADLYAAIHYPDWFIEGTASSVENSYQSRYNMFKMLRAEQGSETQFTDFYDADGLLYNYLHATLDNEDLYFDLEYSRGYDGNGNRVDADQSRYVSGYLAALYLSELAAEKDGGSAIVEDGDSITISSERLRSGLNWILERMHNGETLDQVIYDLSPVDASGKKIYANTDDFEAKFIKGKGVQSGDTVSYSGDAASLQFATKYLNYLVALENTMGQGEKPNGSILMDLDTDRHSPLDSSRDSTSDYLQIVESNELVESTVPNEVALAGGGKSKGSSDAANADSADAGNTTDASDATTMASEPVQDDHEVAGGAASDEQTTASDDSAAE